MTSGMTLSIFCATGYIFLFPLSMNGMDVWNGLQNSGTPHYKGDWNQSLTNVITYPEVYH